MTAHLYRPAVPALFTRIGATSMLTAAALAGTSLIPGMTTRAQADETLAMRAYHIAQSEQGAPFAWGAAGPDAFDCSGLTQFAYEQAGEDIPRTAEDQYDYAVHIRPDHRRVGDLVFFHYGDSIYHVGFYAGRGEVLHAPKSGGLVRLERIWSDDVWYGRVDDD
ncbi:C40 family peptidase [Streptomyces sp. RB6PN25]|uniref:C40 family peptidase n=1 Tax=Streptomyces humicola TaxID=2953240 RepID=A0ABT1PTL4_9ACTN|nr:C40 family peptidase [Streptomyces humicola]MCQ4079882.1 C40 family peptidase [Streptomyces humicola]